jgi:hypothetical protein
VRIPQLAMLSAIIATIGIVMAPSSLAASTAGLRSQPAAAPTVVLVNQPAKSLCTGNRFDVGVWYQALSGGSRAYRISIWGPRHVRFFYRAGMASAAHWQMWKVLAGRHGQYRIVYSGHMPGSTKWSKYQVLVNAKHCAK